MAKTREALHAVARKNLNAYYIYGLHDLLFIAPSSSPRNISVAVVTGEKLPTSTSVKVSWQPPRHANGPITGSCIG